MIDCCNGAPTGAVMGIDFGTDNCVVAIARRKGVDIVSNEASQRSTPSIVSFGASERFIGERGSSQRMMNLKNTVSEPKRLLGRKLHDGEELQDFTIKLEEENEEVVSRVSLCGHDRTFTPTQLVSMILGNLKKIAQADHGSEVIDCAIGVPVYFTEKQRTALREAASIAGLKSLRLINDNTATALAYGITKTDLPEDNPRHVVFLDLGHESTQVSVVAYKKGQLKVLSHSYNKEIGGRHIDKLLFEHFAEVFNQKYGVDARKNSRASLRLRTQCEKLKKTLSANPKDLETPIHVECMMEDKDVSGMFTRAQLEELLEGQGLLAKIQSTIESAMELSGIKMDQVDSVEMVGGTSRIPRVRELVSEFFGKDSRTTINAAESVARGASLACAMLSPAFRVREFRVSDCCLFPVEVQYYSEDGSCKGKLEFERGSEVPGQKSLKLKTASPVHFEWMHSQAEGLPKDASVVLCKHKVNVDPKKGECLLKLDLGLGLDGCPAIFSCVKETQEEEKISVDTTFQLGNLPEALERLMEDERNMASHDELVHETHASKNSLEEYVYKMRDAISSTYSQYESEDKKREFLKRLDDMEEWLYGDGEETSKDVYVEKLKELKQIGDPIESRAKDFEDVREAFGKMRSYIDLCRRMSHTEDKRFSHITAEERAKVVEECNQYEKWVQEQETIIKAAPKTEVPPKFASEVESKRSDLEHACKKIMNRPKPKAPSPPPQADKPMEDQPKEDEQAKEQDEDEPEERKDEDAWMADEAKPDQAAPMDTEATGAAAEEDGPVEMEKMD
ncbi:hypothetical protein GUITHDRAFT_103535 [Guillardia theta CCMP2712]|uniref:Uncharacterized protein n=1 Tax=Guillardia theta (strain CCMP2712) TaxID=905079 RepID=L1JS96_GUITC|nr:hypothetical protein GUITHDRAFT_103535 [Guillardia theta CCMP2712]EKX50953.1 hypothetical protein GUITHDRAFT_103535 [Guillardia theta CCMP2712]|eukprot:XP_005837933.1 hypothetical protein GUITHDRAFT_103535 [Guillardia theta CCMP2712]